MSSSSFLLKPGFWYLFVAVAVLLMFVAGIRRVDDNSHLAIATRENATLHTAIDELQQQQRQIAATLAGRERELQSSAQQITGLTNQLDELRARTPPYGRGNGLATLFNGCNCTDLRVWIDGRSAGILAKQPANGDCGAIGGVTIALDPGVYRVTARDSRRHEWDFPIEVLGDQCVTRTLVFRR